MNFSTPLRYDGEEWRLKHSQFSILTCRNNARLESASTTAVVIVAISIYRIPHSSNPLFLLHRNRIIAERGRIYPIKGLHDSRDFVTGIHYTRRFVEWHLNKSNIVSLFLPLEIKIERVLSFSTILNRNKYIYTLIPN